MQEKFYQYDLTRELAKKYSHVTYLASPTNPQMPKGHTGGHSEPEDQVVLTVFTASLFHFPHERENLLRKAQYIKQLEHPHLLPILDMGIEEEQPFVVRKYLPDGSLRSRLKNIPSHCLELRDALSIVLQVGEALTYAYEHNIVHGNVKPENILLDDNGQAVLTDFYLVSRKDAIIRDQASGEYAFCYMAPEQFVGISDARSDQYALGCLAYELITGRVPFAAQTLASMMGQTNNTVPAPLSDTTLPSKQRFSDGENTSSSEDTWYQTQAA